jgi:hypothetical protein
VSESLEAKLASWAADQRALARALGLSIAEWLSVLEAAAERKTGLTAAVIGAATAAGLGLDILDRLDGAELAKRARELIDPEPPKVESPILAEAIRRKDELEVQGKGASRLKGNASPPRVVGPDLPSADTATSDAPGGEPGGEEPA